MFSVAIFGAGGNMGRRAVDRLSGDPEYRLLCVEPGAGGQEWLRRRGIAPLAKEQAIAAADVVIFAVPDALVEAIAADVVPGLRPGTLVVCLDPASAYADRLPVRTDIAYFVTHPAHPPVFNDETDLEAKRDFFGSGKAKQAVVCALMQGSEEDYSRGVQLAAKLFGPVLRLHRITVEQMALLEPALVESISAPCVALIREAMDEVIGRGVPAQAARDFLLGHIGVQLAILFNEIDWRFSAGALKALEDARKVLFQPDWKRVFEPESLRASVEAITGGPKK